MTRHATAEAASSGAASPRTASAQGISCAWGDWATVVRPTRSTSGMSSRPQTASPPPSGNQPDLLLNQHRRLLRCDALTQARGIRDLVKGGSLRHIMNTHSIRLS